MLALTLQLSSDWWCTVLGDSKCQAWTFFSKTSVARWSSCWRGTEYIVHPGLAQFWVFSAKTQITFVCTNLLPLLIVVSRSCKILKDEKFCSVTGAVKKNLNSCQQYCSIARSKEEKEEANWKQKAPRCASSAHPTGAGPGTSAAPSACSSAAPPAEGAARRRSGAAPPPGLPGAGRAERAGTAREDLTAALRYKGASTHTGKQLAGSNQHGYCSGAETGYLWDVVLSSEWELLPSEKLFFCSVLPVLLPDP